MGKSQRTKGATYEREVCEAFAKALNRAVTRNIAQARDGGNDIDIGPLVVECKRRKSLTVVEKWLNQAEAACVNRADYPHNFPTVVGRGDGTSSLVIMRLKDFLTLTGEELKRRVA